MRESSESATEPLAVSEETSTFIQVETPESPDSFITGSLPIQQQLSRDSNALKTQVSAPSYFQSLAENELPPFEKPKKEPKPRLLVAVNALISEDDVVIMVAMTEADPVNGLKKFLGPLLVKKQVIHNYALSERDFLVSLVAEAMDYAAQRDFNAHKLSGLLTLYLSTHLYFKWYYWSPPSAIWAYFKELTIRHTVEDSPYGTEVFTIEDCYDIMTHFHTIYMTNLPLVHIATFGVTCLKVVWPFKK